MSSFHLQKQCACCSEVSGQSSQASLSRAQSWSDPEATAAPSPSVEQLLLFLLTLFIYLIKRKGRKKILQGDLWRQSRIPSSWLFAATGDVKTQLIGLLGILSGSLFSGKRNSCFKNNDNLIVLRWWRLNPLHRKQKPNNIGCFPRGHSVHGLWK